MTKTQLVKKWGKVGGRVVFNATDEFTKDLDSYLEESRLAENLVIASEHTEGSSANGAVADRFTIDNDTKNDVLYLSNEIKEKRFTKNIEMGNGLTVRLSPIDNQFQGLIWINYNKRIVKATATL